MVKVRALILRVPGTNCDVETGHAFRLAGADDVRLVHINQLIRGEESLGDYQIMVIPGGFTYGDDLGAGTILANELDIKLRRELLGFVNGGGLVLGICNGLQALIKAGLLPEPGAGNHAGVTLATNDSGRFECRWSYLGVNRESPCVFTRGLELIYLPVAHGEGKVVTAAGPLPSPNVALVYTDASGVATAEYPDNPNGSAQNIAGICDSSGRILGLMPHPERHIRGTQHPRWTREGAKARGDGYYIFENAVRWVRGS